MRLDPVFLVAPLPGPKMMPTRRALLLAGAAFTGGAAAGWFVRRIQQPAADSTDPIVLWARDAHRDGRIAELRTHYHGLLHALATAPDDAALWQALEQLVTDLETRDARDDVALIATSLRQMVAAYPGASPDEATLLARLQRLERR